MTQIDDQVKSQDDLVFTTEVDTDFHKRIPESQHTERFASTRMSDGTSGVNINMSQSQLHKNVIEEEAAFKDVIKELVAKDSDNAL